MRSGPGRECWLHFFIVQLERWRVLLSRRVRGERSVYPVHARGTVGTGLVGGPYSTGSIVGGRLWSKPQSYQQPDPATLGLCSSRAWKLSNPGGTETAKLLKAVLGHLASAGPFSSSG